MQLQDIADKLKDLLYELEMELKAEFVDTDTNYDDMSSDEMDYDDMESLPSDTEYNEPTTVDCGSKLASSAHGSTDEYYNGEDTDDEEFIPPLQSELEILKHNAGMSSAYDDVPRINTIGRL